MFNSVSSIIFYIVFNVVIQSISMNDGAVKWQPSSKQYSFIKPHQGKKIYIAHPTFFPPPTFFSNLLPLHGHGGPRCITIRPSWHSTVPPHGHHVQLCPSHHGQQNHHELPNLSWKTHPNFGFNGGLNRFLSGNREREILGLGEMLVARIWCVWAFQFWLGNLTWVK